MARTKKRYTTPFFQLTIFVEGKLLMAVSSEKAPAPLDPKFGAYIKIDPTARRAALATTLVETAQYLVQEFPSAYMACATAASRCQIADTPLGDALASAEDADLPF